MASPDVLDNRALHKAARLLFGGKDKPSRLLRDLCEHLVDLPGNSLAISEAARLVEGLPTSKAALSQLLQSAASSCFSLESTGSSDASVKLNVQQMVQKAKHATATGVLLEELPPPTGFVFGRHPVRPTQRNCAYYMHNGECAFGRACVFNHPAKDPKDVVPNDSNSSSSGSSNVRPSHSSSAASSSSHAAWPGIPAVNGAATGGAAALPSLPEGLAAGGTSSVATQQWELQKQQQQQQQQQPLPPVRAASPSVCPARPGQPKCVMLLMRGVCTAGPSCPYDHTPDGRSSPAPMAAAAAATRPMQPQVEPADLAPAAAGAGAGAAAGAVAGVVPRSAARAAVGNAAGNRTGSTTAAAATATAGSTTRRVAQQYNSPRTEEQEQWLQQKMAQFVHYLQHRDDGHATGPWGDFAFPITGYLAGGYPQRPGAANCPFYMYSGECKFKSKCMFHHPEQVVHPMRFVLTGGMSMKWPPNEPAPYYRLVIHLARLWDYSSCSEAMLKTWLARHLLAEANPDCAMWSKAAAKNAVGAADEWSAGDMAAAAAAGLKPLGPYSCSLAEAGIVLHKLWQEQPDAVAAAAPMPYTKRLRELFSTDPYYEVAAVPSMQSHLFVKLHVAKFKKMLHW